MGEKTLKDLLEEYSTKGDVQFKLVTGEKIHGEIKEIGIDVAVLETGTEKRVVNMNNVVYVSPGVL